MYIFPAAVSFLLHPCLFEVSILGLICTLTTWLDLVTWDGAAGLECKDLGAEGSDDAIVFILPYLNVDFKDKIS